MASKISILIFLVAFFSGVPLFWAGATATEDSKSSKAAVASYKLPWPGMLPDHPLYRLKVLRDKLVLKLLRSDEKRLEFFLLKADKELYAAKLLVDKGKLALAKETALKGEHNFTELVSAYKWMYWYKKPLSPSLDTKIVTAARKHQELLEDILTLVSEEDRTVFEQVKYFSEKNTEEFLSFRTKPQ